MKRIHQALIAATLLTTSSAQASIFPEVVPELDLGSYLGTWYEVASTKPIFQRGCVCVTATYTLRDDGNVGVANSCRKDSVDAEEEIADGIAAPSSNPAKFKVSFGGFGTPFTNYWVVDLADDYSYAVVSSPLRRPIWILSRTPSLPTETMDGIMERLASKGFPVQAISSTLQEGCPQ
jgi:apolipoprotein D and lipocalin family protein